MWRIHDGGSQMKSDRFLIKAAELYYRDGLSQQEIAKKLHTSRTSISRALIQARNEGYVQIRIQYPEPVSYTHLRAHETDSYLVCRLLLEKKKKATQTREQKTAKS